MTYKIKCTDCTRDGWKLDDCNDCVLKADRLFAEAAPVKLTSLLSVEAEAEEYPHVEADEWVKPIMEGYRMMCCDCSLIHEIDFRVIRVIKEHTDGSKDVEEAGGEYEVEIRARRIDR